MLAALTLLNSSPKWAGYIKPKMKDKISMLFFLIIIPCSLFNSMEAIRYFLLICLYTFTNRFSQSFLSNTPCGWITKQHDLINNRAKKQNFGEQFSPSRAFLTFCPESKKSKGKFIYF